MELKKQRVGTFPLEPAQLLLQPFLGELYPSIVQHHANLSNVFCCMRKIKHAQCISTMIVHQSLEPFRSILYCTYFLCFGYPSSMHFKGSIASKRFRICQTRNARDLIAMNLSLLVRAD